jgi:hypothetical protein
MNNSIKQLDKAPDFRHFITKRKKDAECGVCLRVLRAGDLVKAKVVDGVLRTSILYCPTKTPHIDSANEYREYLVNVLSVEENKEYSVAYIEKEVHNWELHRVRRGYLTLPNVKKLTKAHRKAWNDYCDYQVKKLQKEYADLRQQHKQEEQEIRNKIVEIELDKNE